MKVELLLKDCDCAIVTSPASLRYLSGLDISDAVIVLNAKERLYLTNPLYEVAVKGALSKDWTVRILSRAEIATFLSETARVCDRVGVEFDDMTLSRFRTIFGTNGRNVRNLSPVLAAMRIHKTSEELAVIKQAEGIVDKTFAEVLPLLKVGVSEREIANEIYLALLRNGADGTSFDTIVAFGERAAMPHAVPSGRVLRKGDCVLMDFGAKYKGYCSDFTRTVVCGDPDERFLRAYALVLEAQRAAIRYLEKGGRSASEADAVARKVIDASEFKGAFNHTLGHGVGVEIHESPTLAGRSSDVLSDGMVFTLEPGIYVEGAFGVRIESLVALENGKLTVIDRSEKEIFTV